MLDVLVFPCGLGQVVKRVDDLDNIENTVPVLTQTVVQYCENAILAVASSPSLAGTQGKVHISLKALPLLFLPAMGSPGNPVERRAQSTL